MLGKPVDYNEDIKYDKKHVPIFEYLLPIGHRENFGSIATATVTLVSFIIGKFILQISSMTWMCHSYKFFQ